MFENLLVLPGEEVVTNEFSVYVAHFSYLGIFLWFTTLDQLTPLPEEITLLMIGYMAANHVFNPIIAGAIALLAFIAVDTLYYFLARSGHQLADHVIKAKKSLLYRYTDRMKSSMVKSLFILCFVPRMRLFGPIMVGSLNLSFRRFFLTDLIALSLFTALYISLGIVFHRGLYTWLKELKSLRHGIFISVSVAVAIWMMLLMSHRNKQINA